MPSALTEPAPRGPSSEPRAEPRSPAGRSPGTWTFLTNHAHVLLCLAADPEARLRDVAGRVGITERAVQQIVSDLAAAGVVERTREGRRNRYTLHPEVPLRHPVEAHRRVADLIALVPRDPAPAPAGQHAAPAPQRVRPSPP